MFADPEVLAFGMSSPEVKDLLECTGEFIFVKGKEEKGCLVFFI